MYGMIVKYLMDNPDVYVQLLIMAH